MILKFSIFTLLRLYELPVMCNMRSSLRICLILVTTISCVIAFPQTHLGKIDGEAHENSTSEIASENYNVSLKCVPGEIELTFNFADNFRGIIYAQRDASSDCQLRGDGSKQYLMKISLQKCGTTEEPERTFTNTIVLRYHPVLEIGGDETKTIVCKYGQLRFVFGNTAANESIP